MERNANEVDAYIADAPTAFRKKLRSVREAIREAAPEATESISYRMPHYSYKGRLAWFGYHLDYIGLYLRPPVVEEHRKELAGYITTMSAVHLPLDRPVPARLVKKLVRARVRINESESSR